MMDMQSVVEKLQRIGLTEYEAKVYLCLLKDRMNGATKLSIKSGVPRTKVYQVLDSLGQKGWIKIYSGIPLLFRAADPNEIFTKVKEDYGDFLTSVQTKLEYEVSEMREKFIIQKFDIGLPVLKNELKKAKTIWLANATNDLLKKISESFNKAAQIQVVLFPGEKKFEMPNANFRVAEMEIVSLIYGQEVPSTSIVLDEERIFTVIQDPVDKKFIVHEMLYDDCSKCFKEWYQLGWSSSKEL